MKELYYIYNMKQWGSFNNISKEHIKRLSKYIKVREIDEMVLDNAMWVDGKRVLLHPIGYILLGDNEKKFKYKIKRLDMLKRVCDKLGGFDTADSTKISQKFVNVLNEMDVIFVPSNFAKDVYTRAEVETDVRVLPHGLPDCFLEPKKSNEIPQHPALKELYEIKRNKRVKLILFFLMHSGYRKGADLVAKAISEIQQTHNNVYLVVKTHDVVDPFFSKFINLKMIHIKGWFNDLELRQLYDLCDIVVCPSRGGGFELNALEGIARGKPTLFTDAMCFKDYSEYGIPIKVERAVKVLPGNPIHIGDGYEINLNDFVRKLELVLKYYSRYKRKAEKASKEVRKRYSWNNIVKNLYDILIDIGFI